MNDHIENDISKGYWPNKVKEKRPDLNTSCIYLSKTEASNADKQLIETILGNLIEATIIVNRKTPTGLDSFRRLKVVDAPVHALILILNKQTLQVTQKLSCNFQNNTGFL